MDFLARGIFLQPWVTAHSEDERAAMKKMKLRTSETGEIILQGAEGVKMFL
jgi:hypothetical protein